MPAITRSGDSCTGHDRCPPRPATNGAPTVSAGGKPVLCEGDSYTLHACKDHAPHDAVLAQGAPHVSIAGKAVGRIGDPVSCGGSAAEGEASVTIGNLGGEEYGRELAFEMVKERILSKSSSGNESASESARPTDMEKLLLCLPDIAEAEAGRSSLEEDKKGWSLLQTMFHQWFTGAANTDAESNSKIFWVDMDWIRGHGRVWLAYQELIKEEYLFSWKAQNVITENLRRDGLLTDKATSFDYITPHASRPPQDWWKAGYFQQVTAPGFIAGYPDGLMAAMGNFDLRALAAGKVEALPDGGHRITIQRVSVIVWDSFNFHGEYYLLFWSCTKNDFSVTPGFGYSLVSNSDFNAFRKKYYIGNDFMVLSQPHSVEHFEEFSYDAYP